MTGKPESKTTPTPKPAGPVSVSTVTYPNGQRMFADDGTMLDSKGNRSIFDDVDK